MGNYRLEVRNLHKRFPGVYAIKGGPDIKSETPHKPEHRYSRADS